LGLDRRKVRGFGRRGRLGRRLAFQLGGRKSLWGAFVGASLVALLPNLLSNRSLFQAISGAGKTFESWPELVDNVIPFIKGEEEKSEQYSYILHFHHAQRSA
jgi:hypothetical protein